MDNSHGGQPVGAVIPAAGRGSRLGGTRKQFRVLGDAPVLVHTVRRFTTHPSIDALVVVTGSDAVSRVEELLSDAGVAEACRVVAGGETRQESVASGLAALPAEIQVVLVHDAVRPFVTARSITGVVEGVYREGAAALAIPVSDTLRRAESGAFGETVDRRDLYRMQTPQGFRREWLQEAHRRAGSDGVVETDDVALVQRCDHAVKLVRGSAHNIKITTPADWELAQMLWEMKRDET